MFSVNVGSPVAVYIQIENQIKFAIASGRVKPLEALPSVREMSTLLNINPNTVTKAYRGLEILDLVHTRRGVRVTVAEQAPKTIREMTWAMVKNHLAEAVAECLAAGLPIPEIRKVVSDSIDAGATPYRAPRKR